MTVYNAVSAIGLLCFLGFLFLISRNHRRVSLRVIVWGLALQIIFAVFVFLVPFGSQFFLLLNDATMQLIDSAFEGIRFLFGPLAASPGKPGSIGFILAFQALPSIIFFAALMELLYYAGIMERLIGLFARIFAKVMGISGAESLCASAQIFLGIESNLTIRPYLKEMTISELMVVLTTGMATIASSVLGFYVIILSGIFPTVAGHLISASILLAPAAIVASKIIFPEVGLPKTLGKIVSIQYQKAGNPIEAIINGAMTGVRMVVGIGALLIAFIGIVALFDSGLSYIGRLAGSATGMTVDLSLNSILGYLFYPFTVAMGVPLDDAPQIARILGERIIMTEVKSYQDLSLLVQSGSIVHPRSVFIATYALCGFAHIPSLAIFVGGTSTLVPERTRDITILGIWSLVAANIACFMTGALAGIFYSGQGGILTK
ncbi:MAG: nucleoside transporter C-terminal domain-containing protein [Syntrophorhabdus sp.]